MPAICQFCGASKANPVYSCPKCYRTPKSDLECGEAILLSSACMSDHDLASCAVDLKQGIPINLPPSVIASVAADYRKVLDEGEAQEESHRRARDEERARRSAKEAALVYRFALILVAFVIPVLCLWLAWDTPAVRLWYAKKQDTPAAYSKVMIEFPGTIQATEAQKRYLVLTDDSAWAAAALSNSFKSLRSYLNSHPEGKHHLAAKDALFAIAQPLWVKTVGEQIPKNIEAFPQSHEEVAERFPVIESLDAVWKKAVEEKSITKVASFRNLSADNQRRWPILTTIKDLARTEWEQVKKSRSLTRIDAFSQAYPELREWYDPEEARQALYDDITWVKEQDQLMYYQRFVSRHPKHPDIPAMQKRIIDMEVAAIAAGDHGALPKAEASGAPRGTRTKIALQNDTGHELTVWFSGKESSKVVLAVGLSQTVNLPNGTFKVAASVNAAHVRNYYGTDEYKGGVYDLSFYISSNPLNLPGDYLPSPLKN